MRYTVDKRAGEIWKLVYSRYEDNDTLYSKQ
jgi:hypothetical protein